MKRRILSMLLVLTMVFALTSCGDKKSGSDDGLLAAQIDQMSDMSAGYAEVTMDIDTDLMQKAGVDLSKLSLKITAQTDKDNEKVAECGILYSLDSSDDFKKLTTMIVDTDVVYINLKELKVAAKDLLGKFGGEQYLAVLDMLPNDEYIKVDPAVLSQQALTNMSATDKDTNITLTKDERKALQDMMKVVATEVEEAVKDVDPKVVSTDGAKTVIQLNDKNAKAAFEALAKTDFSKCYDEVVKSIKKIALFDTYVKDVESNKDKYLKDIKDGLQKAADAMDKAQDFAVEYTIGVTGSAGKKVAEQKLSAEVTDEEGKVNIAVSMKAEEGKKESVTIPTDALDYMDLMNSLMSGLGGSGAY